MSKVSRSVYQKLKEENKRLLSDIEILVKGQVFDFIKVKSKWVKHFEEQNQIK